LFIVQSLFACMLLTAISIPLVLKNPLSQLYNYPYIIQDRVKSLPQYEGRIPTTKNRLSVKLTASLFFIAVLTAIVYFSSDRNFISAFLYCFALWMIVNLYDVFILDWAWFCHCKRIRIPGTEDMVKEYESPLYHIIGGVKGTVIGLAVSIIVSALTVLITAVVH